MNHLLCVALLLFSSTPALSFAQRYILHAEDQPPIVFLGTNGDMRMSFQDIRNLQRAVQEAPQERALLVDSVIALEHNLPSSAGSFIMEAMVYRDITKSAEAVIDIVRKAAVGSQRNAHSAHPLPLIRHFAAGAPISSEHMSGFAHYFPSSLAIDPCTFFEELQRLQKDAEKFLSTEIGKEISTSVLAEVQAGIEQFEAASKKLSEAHATVLFSAGTPDQDRRSFFEETCKSFYERTNTLLLTYQLMKQIQACKNGKANAITGVYFTQDIAPIAQHIVTLLPWRYTLSFTSRQMDPLLQQETINRSFGPAGKELLQ